MGSAGRWIARNGGSVILVLLGASLLGASFFRSDDAPYAIGLLIFGSSLVTVGVVLPRLRNAEVGPATGFKLISAWPSCTRGAVRALPGPEEPPGPCLRA